MEEVEGRVLGGCVLGDSGCIECTGKEQVPLPWYLGGVFRDDILECPVDSFYLSIPLWMIGCRLDVMDVVSGGQDLDEVVDKL